MFVSVHAVHDMLDVLQLLALLLQSITVLLLCLGGHCWEGESEFFMNQG